ncbi:MAG: P-loop NTPase fold protein [Limnothrix sp.]
MQKAELTQPEPIDFSRQPELISSFKNILGEIETVIGVLQREKIDFEFLLKVNDGLVKDFQLAISKYPEAQQYWDELSILEINRKLRENPEYIEDNRENLIKQFKQFHQYIQLPINAANTIEVEAEKYKVNYVPQGISNDLATGDDQLSIEDELQAIADVLLLRQLQPPIAVGILGNWGSGKSFGMHLIQERVHEIRCRPLTPAEAWGEGLENDPDREKKLSPYVGHVYQIKFNAWSYAKANLWASLMQEIFAELDRQITLENQLQEAGLDLLSHQNLSEILAKVESGDRQWFIDYLDKEGQKENFKTIQEKDQLQNMVLKTIADSKTEAVQSFEAKQKKLQKAKLAFEQKQKEIITEADTGQHLLIGASINIIEKRIGNPLLDKLREDVKEELEKQNLDPENVPDFKEVVKGIMVRKMEDRSQAISWSIFSRWSCKNWRVLAVLMALIGSCVIVAYVLAHSQRPDLITQIVSMLAPSLPTIVVGQKLVDSFLKWKEEAELALYESQEQIEQAIEQRIETNPDLQVLQGNIQRLEQELAEDSKKLPKSEYVSLAEFVGDRLKPENYSNHLGILNQVQQDLKNLSDRLLPPDQNWDKIKNMFPRGIPRVVLYIDDLDRCPPRRVVEVLETVQLLLKTQLFVVVLAVDDRYIARALEEVYSGVLKRRGKPSGIDYLEKIIQIPYRMRPISREVTKQYLSSQIQVVIPEESEQNQSDQSQKSLPVLIPEAIPNTVDITTDSSPIPIEKDQTESAQVAIPIQQTTQQSFESETIEIQKKEALSSINKINTITAQELELIVDCCKYVDITPRIGKRLINIYKILKIIWQQRREPSEATKKILFSFLALSGRYPDFMRSLFEEIDTQLQEKDNGDNQFDRDYILGQIYPQVPAADHHAQREWRKFHSDILRMIIPASFTLEKADFDLALSFCFVGDIGYDPDDFSKNPIMPVQQ